MTDEKTEAAFKRLLTAARVKTDSALAQALELTPQSVSEARKKNRIPPGWAIIIAEKYQVSLDWLVFGRGSMRPGTSGTVSGLRFEEVDFSPRDVPVIGLAECGLKGWFNKGSIALTVSVPFEHSTPDMFAVIAVGTSMQPEGIKQGFVVICDPDLPPMEDELIYIEKNDGSASIKKYKGQDEKWLVLQAWLPPDDDGTQKPYMEQVAIHTVNRIASAVIVKRRA